MQVQAGWVIGALALHAFNIAGYGVGVQDISTKSASLISGVTAGIGVMTGAASQYITGALLDRLTHHVSILEMNGESYRLAQSRKATQNT